MRKSLMLPVLALMALSACETIAGAGQDLATVGSAVTGTAKNVQREL